MTQPETPNLYVPGAESPKSNGSKVVLRKASSEVLLVMVRLMVMKFFFFCEGSMYINSSKLILFKYIGARSFMMDMFTFERDVEGDALQY